jgi:anti-sigma factor RsiW
MSLALDHEANAAQMDALHAHLRGCAGCAAAWARWQALDARFRAAPMLAAPPQLAERVLARLATRRRRRFWRGWLGAGLFIAWLAVAGVILLALLGGAWWGLTHPLHASLALSAAARLLSGVLWPVRSAGVMLTSAGVSPQAGVAAYLGLTSLLCGVWVWLVIRRAPLSRTRVTSYH